jgi:hypothetical protein
LLAIPACFGQTPPTVLTGITAPVGIGATQHELLVSSPYCQTAPATRTLKSMSFFLGAPTFTEYAILPDQLFNGTDTIGTCAENYFAISPGFGGFPFGTTYVFAVINQNPADPTSGARVILKEPGNTVFVTLPPGFAPANHASVSFDRTGAFDFAMIVTGRAGVIGYSPSGTVLFEYPNPDVSTDYALESATVGSPFYALCPSCLFVTASTDNPPDPGKIYVVKPGTPSGTPLTLFSLAPHEPENLIFVPGGRIPTCTYGGFAYFVSGFSNTPGTEAFSTTGAVLAYTAAQLAPYAGQFLIPDESSGLIYAFSGPNNSTIFSRTGYHLEGATLAYCPAPLDP